MRCLKCRLDGVPEDAAQCPRCGINLHVLMHDVLAPGTLLRNGDYRIEYAIGRGGFGITYRAWHTRLDSPVAIKEFFPTEYAQRETATRTLSVPDDAQETFVRGLGRFISEGRILKRVQHPNVVRVDDLFEERGTAYLVMELVEGHTLKDALRARPDYRLPPDDVKRIVGQLVSALGVTHAKDVYHLDIKPDNVLLTAADGHVILVDFGAARQGFANKHTQAFTMDYAPPEIFSGADVSPASDLYELGVMLHEMLTGTRPPNALRRLQGEEWSPSGMGEPWRGLIDGALRLNRDERPATLKAWWEAAFPSAAPPVIPVTPVQPVTPVSPVPTGKSVAINTRGTSGGSGGSGGTISAETLDFDDPLTVSPRGGLTQSTGPYIPPPPPARPKDRTPLLVGGAAVVLIGGLGAWQMLAAKGKAPAAPAATASPSPVATAKPVVADASPPPAADPRSATDAASQPSALAGEAADVYKGFSDAMVRLNKLTAQFAAKSVSQSKGAKIESQIDSDLLALQKRADAILARDKKQEKAWIVSCGARAFRRDFKSAGPRLKQALALFPKSNDLHNIEAKVTVFSSR